MVKLFLYCFRDFDEKSHFERISQEREFQYSHTSEYPSLENAELAKGYDAISIIPTPIDAELLEKFHGLGVRFILTRSIGYDHINLAKAKDLGIKISHVTYAPESVADYAIMLMMMSLRKMNLIMRTAEIQDYTLQKKIGKTISKCTIGVIGTGKIGQTLINHLSGFGCKIFAYDPYITEQISSSFEYVSLEKLYKECDVITLHIPASSSNYHLLNKDAFRMMKHGVVIVNTARGTLINTDDLIGYLEIGHIGGVALDVLENETDLYFYNRIGDCIENRQLAILRSFPNVIVTPHIAFYTDEVVGGMARSTIDCLFDLIEGKENPLIIS